MREGYAYNIGIANSLAGQGNISSGNSAVLRFRLDK